MVHINAPLFARTVPSNANGAAVNGGLPSHAINHAGGFEPPSRPQPFAQANGSQGPPPGGAPPPFSTGPNAPQAGAGLRRRANLGSTPFMQQQRSSTPGNQGGATGGAQQVMQYYPRQDAQTRYQNAMQVESTIVEVMCCRNIHAGCRGPIRTDSVDNVSVSLDYRHVHADGNDGRGAGRGHLPDRRRHGRRVRAASSRASPSPSTVNWGTSMRGHRVGGSYARANGFTLKHFATTGKFSQFFVDG
jgi:hypothetical protein